MADGFEIADGYVTVHAEIDQRSVIAAADQLTRGVRDQMDTGVAFANNRESGRLLGTIVGHHGGPNAADEITRGLTTWINQGVAAGRAREAGSALGGHMAAGAAPRFVDEVIEEINRRAGAGGGSGGNGTVGIGQPGAPRVGDGGRGGDSRGGRGGDSRGGRGGEGGRGGQGGAGGDSDGRSLGERLGLAALQGFLSSFTGGLPSLGTVAIPFLSVSAVLIGGGLAALAAPAFAAAFAAALIGGAGLGVIGLGAFLLKENPQVQKAGQSFVATLKDVFTNAATPLIDPFVESFGILERLISDNAGTILEMFTAIAPTIVPLTRGFAGFVEAALPGFVALIKAAVPFLQDLESTLPRFGEAIGQFLTIIAEAGPEASLFFRDFLHVLGIVIVAIGYMISWLAQLYGASREAWMLIGGIFSAGGRAGEAAFNKIQGAGERAWRFLKGVWRGIREDGDGAIAWFRGLPGRVTSALLSIPGRVRGIFAGAGQWLIGAGRNIINGLIQGIRDAIPGLSGLLNSVTNLIPDWKGPPEKDRRLLEPTGRMIMGGLRAGIQRELGGLRDDLQGVTTAIPGMAEPATNPAPRGGVTININGVWDFSKGVPAGLVAALFDALDRYEKSYA